MSFTIFIENESLSTDKSALITKAEYEPLYHHLHVWFKTTNAKYTYKGVSEETWEEFKLSESKGKYFHKFIKPTHSFLKEESKQSK